jgi:rhomboid protease GluP
MEPLTQITETWLTRRPDKRALNVTLMFGLVLLFLSDCFFINDPKFNDWMPASGMQVFGHHEFWRLWTTLFAHADLGHLMGNSILFIPLTYLLSSYFGLFFLPLLGILLGGAINWMVLKTLPDQSILIGISGVVYWMGAIWLTLYVLIDRRQRLRRRFAYALFLSLLVFVPESYKPEISYLSHFLGFLLGVVSGLAVYGLFHRRFRAAEVTQVIEEEHDIFDISDDSPLCLVIDIGKTERDHVRRSYPATTPQLSPHSLGIDQAREAVGQCSFKSAPRPE